MKICVGIVSYLPEPGKIRDIRTERLKNLIMFVDKYFKLPIILIAQNYKDLCIETEYSRIYMYKYEKPLGIVGARKELQRVFISSEFDNLIMMDDDLQLVGSNDSINSYLNKIRENPHGYGKFKSLLLHLFVISKELYKTINYPDLDPCNGDFLEDLWLIKTLDKLYPGLSYSLSTPGLTCKADASCDPASTWYHGQFNKSKMGDKARSLVNEYVK